MKDGELRAIVLERFYERRKDITHKWHERHVPEGIVPGDFFLICDQLRDQNLISWRPFQERPGQIKGGVGVITAFGVDVVEGTSPSPITITFDRSQIVTINGLNNIVGNHNSVNSDEIHLAINNSNFSDAEKAAAKSLWQKVCENKLLNSVVGSVFGAAAKHVLETTTHSK